MQRQTYGVAMHGELLRVRHRGDVVITESRTEFRYVETGEFADESTATVVGADFRGACMTGARLAGARLRSSRLRNASGHDVDLSGATLEETDLWHGWLADINVSGARFVGGRPPDPNQDPAQQDPDCVKAA